VGTGAVCEVAAWIAGAKGEEGDVADLGLEGVVAVAVIMTTPKHGYPFAAAGCYAMTITVCSRIDMASNTEGHVLVCMLTTCAGCSVSGCIPMATNYIQPASL
jgi:hypothetical protein